MITIVSFSGRPNGNSMGVANVMKECLKDKEVQVVDFSEMSVEPCNYCSCDDNGTVITLHDRSGGIPRFRYGIERKAKYGSN